MNLSSVIKKSIFVCIIILFMISSGFSGISGHSYSTIDFYKDNCYNIEFVPGEFIIKFKAESI
ncbi:MAG: hypothetical protein JSU91_07435, partial [Thermoplasmatales archaeon]